MIEIMRKYDKCKLMKYLNEHWKRNHILSLNEELLNWQHKEEKGYNFVILKNKDEEIDGVLGFIPTFQYDSNLKSQKDYWLVIWKASSKKNFNGLDLLKYFRKTKKPNSFAAIGNGEIAQKIYEVLKFKTGVLNHYYILNDKIKNFNIAEVKNIDIKINQEKSCFFIEKIKDINELKTIFDIYKPYKTVKYVINRYLNHPIYKYQLYGIYDDNKKLYSTIITRKIEHNNSYCLRIVDVYGKLDNLSNLYKEFQNLLKKENSEYIDIYNYGIDDRVFYNIGFEKRINDEIIIPNYFEPYECKNIEIKFAYKSCYNEYVIFKGDSDQDRPNLL